MHLIKHLHLLVEYNCMMNKKFYTVAAGLPEETLHADKGAFFGSIFRTLTHIAVGDTVWLKRIAEALPECKALNPVRALPYPEALNAVLEQTFEALTAKRLFLDKIFEHFVASVSEGELLRGVRYRTMKGEEFNKEIFSVLMHVFNHQTHHRGQITTLFAQSGVDVGVTDLAVFIPNIEIL